MLANPATSVWTVLTMPNRDIVSGCSNGIVHIFSKAEGQWASIEGLKEYGKSVVSQALLSQQLGDLDKEQDVDRLAAPGTLTV